MFRTVLAAATVLIAACQGPVQETAEEVVPVSGPDQPEWRLVIHVLSVSTVARGGEIEAAAGDGALRRSD